MFNKSENRPLKDKPKELRFIQLEVTWLRDNFVLVKYVSGFFTEHLLIAITAKINKTSLMYRTFSY